MLAVLCKTKIRKFMSNCQSLQVLLGRMTLDNVVDIDLGKEGRANKVSRRQVRSLFDYVSCCDQAGSSRLSKHLKWLCFQATIRLKEDGVFYLKNLGRRDLSVNNIPIASGQHAMLGSNCLIEVSACFELIDNKQPFFKYFWCLFCH